MKSILTQKSINYPDFNAIKKKANGGLEPDIYIKIFEEVLQSSPGNIVEVGAAHGAGTIIMALALKQLDRGDKVYSFEKIIGGSREAYGSVSENKDIILNNLKHFDVEDQVEMIFDDVDNGYDAVPSDKPISLLMLDADGAIDRDFRYFYNKVSQGSPIIIDDCQNFVKIKRNGFRKLRIDLKHLLTYKLVSFYQEKELIELKDNLLGTVFCRKHESVTSVIDFEHFNTINIYREMVFTDGILPNILKRKAIIALRKHPVLYRFVKKALGKNE